MKKLLTIIDMQYDFVMPKGKLSLNCPQIVKPANVFVREHANKFDHILATRDDHIEPEYTECKYSDEAKKFPIHCEVGTQGHKWLIKMPANKVSWLGKKDNSMWHASANIDGTGNANVPLKWNPAEWEMVLFGVASDICVAYAMDGFLKRGYSVTVLTDLCKGLFKEMDAVANETYVDYLKSGQLRLITSTQFTKENKGK
ncbi:MAG: isochorismatase family protein [Alphaproteobacteria bacterium]|nr:isochorismatase family protein [Alphaproteobacteria bacterium]